MRQPRAAGRRSAPWTDEISGDAAARQLGHRRRLGRRPDPAARGRRAPDRGAGAVRPDPHRPAGAAPAHRGLAPPRRRRVRRRSSPSSSSSSPAAPTSPIDRRVFELVDGRLVEFDGGAAGLMAGARGVDRRPSRSIRVEVADAVATITLDRPEALNALTVADEGRAAARRFGRSPATASVRAVVLTGRRAGVLRRPGPQGAPRARRGAARGRAARALQPDHPGDARARPADRRGDQRRRRRGRRVARLRLRPADRRREAPASCSRSGGSASCPDSGATWFLPRLVGCGQGRRAGAARRPAVRRPTRSGSGWSRGSCPATALATEARAMAARLAAPGAGRARARRSTRSTVPGRSTSTEPSRRRRTARASPARAPITPRGWRPSSRSGRRGSPGSSRAVRPVLAEAGCVACRRLRRLTAVR